MTAIGIMEGIIRPAHSGVNSPVGKAFIDETTGGWPESHTNNS